MAGFWHLGAERVVPGIRLGGVSQMRGGVMGSGMVSVMVVIGVQGGGVSVIGLGLAENVVMGSVAVRRRRHVRRARTRAGSVVDAAAGRRITATAAAAFHHLRLVVAVPERWRETALRHGRVMACPTLICIYIKYMIL